MNFNIAVVRTLRTLGLLAAVLLFSTGCSLPRHEVLEGGEGDRSVVLISGLRAAKPADPALLSRVTPNQLEYSLRRVMVQVSTWISFVLEKPTPLLSGEQLQWVLKALHPRLLTLQPDQRIELNFKDQFKGLNVQVQVYPDGKELVFRFVQLVSNPPLPGTPVSNEMPLHRAHISAQAGQRVDYDGSAAYLFEPLAAEEVHSAAALQVKLDLLDTALSNSVITRDEETKLRALITDHPEVSLSAWELYWNKRETLHKALGQGLFTPDEYEQRKLKLLKEQGL